MIVQFQGKTFNHINHISIFEVPKPRFRSKGIGVGVRTVYQLGLAMPPGACEEVGSSREASATASFRDKDVLVRIKGILVGI